jgi:hypothetical protein
MKGSASWWRRFPVNAIADLTGGALCVILELHPEEGRKPEMAYLSAMGIGEGDEPMFPMKKPIRLLAMRFQVD